MEFIEWLVNQDQISLWLQILCLSLYFGYVHSYGKMVLWGPRLGVMAEIAWVTLSLYMSLYLVALAGVFGILIHARNWLKWKRKGIK